MTVDIVVVGGGLMGSAAARHLAEGGHDIVVFAPAEPEDWTDPSAGPFASHYDSSRVTRIVADDPVWSELAVRSCGRYGDIEARSGITFHNPVGLAWVGKNTDRALAIAAERGADIRPVDRAWLRETTGIAVPDGHDLECLYEGAPAGVVNPRRMAAAQLRLAEAAGATIITEPARRVRPGMDTVEVVGDTHRIDARRVLLATGAWGDSMLDGASTPALGLRPLLRTTVRIDLGPAETMPSLILSPTPWADLVDLYWNPPSPYPDGRVLFKVGCEVEGAPEAEGPADLVAWFNSGGSAAEADLLLDCTRQLLPDAEFFSHEQVPCVVTRSPSGRPLIGWVDDRIAVCVGGNGASAKSSDEIGRLASTLFDEGGWSDDVLDADLFTPG